MANKRKKGQGKKSPASPQQNLPEPKKQKAGSFLQKYSPSKVFDDLKENLEARKQLSVGKSDMNRTGSVAAAVSAINAAAPGNASTASVVTKISSASGSGQPTEEGRSGVGNGECVVDIHPPPTEPRPLLVLGVKGERREREVE